MNLAFINPLDWQYVVNSFLFTALLVYGQQIFDFLLNSKCQFPDSVIYNSHSRHLSLIPSPKKDWLDEPHLNHHTIRRGDFYSMNLNSYWTKKYRKRSEVPLRGIWWIMGNGGEYAEDFDSVIAIRNRKKYFRWVRLLGLQSYYKVGLNVSIL